MVLVLLAAPACIVGGETNTRPNLEPSLVKMPSQIVGLRVTQEEVAEDFKKVERTYVDSVGLFALREGDLIRATLQVNRLNRVARPSDPRFRRSVIELLGASTPVELRVGDVTVFSTSGNQQNIFVWFRERGLFVLTVHQDFEFPRTLLRRMTTLELR